MRVIARITDGGWRLDDGVVVRPGGFEAVGQLLNGLEAIAFPEEEAYECCCETACYPNQILHACPLGEYCCARCEGLDAGERDGVSKRLARAGQYTGEAMDRVRFGRALGYGARHAAKTLMQAADAATAPSGKAAAPTAKEPSAREPGARAAAAPVVERVVRTRPTVAETKKHAGKLGRAVWTPLARFSSVVWLQVTGLFFAIIATFLAQGAWRERAARRLPVGSHAAQKFWVLVVAFALFAYFCVSNFVRAYLRERK